MKALLLALLLPVVASAHWMPTLNERITIDAIANVETGNRDIVGNARERGPCQLIPAVQARVHGHDKAAAGRWLKIVIADMRRHRIPVNVYNVALCWNAGVNAVRRSRAPDSSYDYALRVTNTYDSLISKHP